MIIGGWPSNLAQDLTPHGTNDADIIVAAVSRFAKRAIHAATARRGERKARIPWITGELPSHMTERYRKDERKTTALLAGQGSIAGAIFTSLRLARGLVKTAPKKLQTHRRRQVVLAGILCATRYKYFAGNGELLLVKCANLWFGRFFCAPTGALLSATSV